MSRRDGSVVIALLAVLAVLAGALALPAFRPAASPAPTPTAAPPLGHVQGVLGRPSSVTPLTARTQADRDLVALLFRGLVRLGPGSSVLPDLAERWTVTEKGARWTFQLRPDAAWHDGVPVTSRDVVYTVGVLHDPSYAGPLASTWAEVEATALDELTVQFDLGDPVGGFLQAAALPLLPAHVLAGAPVATLADDAFAREPLGNGAFALVELSADRAVLEPVLSPVAAATGPLREPGAGEVSTRIPRLGRLELRFYDTAEELAAAFTAGEVESAADLPPAAAVALAAATPDARAIRYPATTLTALAFNLRATRGPFADPRTRRALLAAIDRAALVKDAPGRRRRPGRDPDPAVVVGLRRQGGPGDRLRPRGGVEGPPGRRLAQGRRGVDPARRLEAADGRDPRPEAAANAIAHAAAVRVAAAWTSLGLATSVEALPPGALVDRLRTADFTAAVIDVNMGLDPDPYPILASSQARTGGANICGIQDVALDKALVSARAPGSAANRTKAYRTLQGLLGTLQPMPTLFFRDSVLVVGPGPRRTGGAAHRRPGRSLLGRDTMGNRRAVTLSARFR